MVIRLTQALTPEAVAKLNAKFVDFLQKGEIVQGVALPTEKNEPDIFGLPRLIFTPFRNNFGRLRCLINAINDAQTLSDSNL